MATTKAYNTDSKAKLRCFLDSLRRREGFLIGVDTYAEAEALLDQLPGTPSDDRLRTLIAPLVARNKEEQDQFYNAFNQFFDQPDSESREGPKETGTSPPPPTPKPIQAEIDRQKKRARRQQQWAGGIIMTLLIITGIGVVNILMPREPEPVVVTEQPVEPIVDITAPDTTGARPNLSPKPDSLAFIAGYFKCYLPPELPEDQTIPKPLPLTYWLFLGLLGLLYLYELLRYLFPRLQNLYISRKHSRPPFIWEIHLKEKPELQEMPGQLGPTLRHLRRRLASEQVELHVPASIQATIQQAGLPELVYRPRTRPAEYLMLLDYNARQVHQVKLFELLFKTFKDNDVHVERFFYEGDPRICWNEHFPKGIQLKELASRYKQYRLLLFGNAFRLLNPQTGRLMHWARQFKNWQDMAILTPRPSGDWSFTERKLAEAFLLLPANPNGLREVVRHFEQVDNKVALAAWPEPHQRERPVLASEAYPRESLIAQGYSEELLKWISVCAIYPEINWDLTLYLGQILSEKEKGPAFKQLLSLPNIIRLFRIPWFQEGVMPEGVREKLMAKLNEEKEEEIADYRRAILDLLRNNAPPKHSYAYRDYCLQLAVQEALLNPNSLINQWNLRKWIKRQAEPGTGTAIQKADEQQSKLDLPVSSRWGRLFFPEHSFGLQPAARWAAIGILALLLLTTPVWFNVPLWPGPVAAQPAPAPEVVAARAVVDTVSYAHNQLIDKWLAALDDEFEDNHEKLIPIPWEVRARTLMGSLGVQAVLTDKVFDLRKTSIRDLNIRVKGLGSQRMQGLKLYTAFNGVIFRFTEYHEQKGYLVFKGKVLTNRVPVASHSFTLEIMGKAPLTRTVDFPSGEKTIILSE